MRYGSQHLDALTVALTDLRSRESIVDNWGAMLAEVLCSGGRLLVAGNGGSAAQAQHLTAELVGRYRDDRPAYSAIALHSETSSLTAIGNDYGYEEVFARQIQAHGRPGDIVCLLSTSGRSPNLLAAARAAREQRLRVWSLTGALPNPLAEMADATVAVDADETSTVQEAHLVVIHLICAAFDRALGVGVSGRDAAVVGR